MLVAIITSRRSVRSLHAKSLFSFSLARLKYPFVFLQHISKKPSTYVRLELFGENGKDQFSTLQRGYKSIYKQDQEDKVKRAADPNAGFCCAFFENEIVNAKSHKIAETVHNQINGCKAAKQREKLEDLDGE